MPAERPAWMPKYSTDEADVDEAETEMEGEELRDGAEGDAYDPWDAVRHGSKHDRGGAAGGGEAADPDDDGDEAFAAPPGLGNEPEKDRDALRARKRHRRTQAAALLMLWTAGFLVFAGFLVLVGGHAGAETARIDYRYDGDRHSLQAADEIAFWTALVGWVLLLLAVPFAASGAGLLYDRPWARPLGIAMGVFGLLLIPIGTILNGIALGMFGGGAGEDA